MAGATTADPSIGAGVAALAKDNTFTIITVPEPASAVMFIFGGLGLAIIFRHRSVAR